MDFFKYASVASLFADKLWVQLLVGALCFAIVFIFQAVGLYILAGHEGCKNRWMAFVPFLNTYYIGVLGQKNRCIRGVSTKTLALILAVFEAILFSLYVFYYVGIAAVAPYYKPTGETTTSMWSDQVVDVYGLVGVPDRLAWAAWCYNVLGVILEWVQLAFLFLQVLVLSAFYQTFAARRYFIFTLTSVFFPVRGIIIFIIRNNRGMNYRDYLRREQERQYRMYRQYTGQNFNDSPYNQNPYSRSYSQPPQEDPFRDSFEKGNENAKPQSDDPFSEFNFKKPDDDNFKH